MRTQNCLPHTEERELLITDELRGIQWYDMDGPLDSEKTKLYDEYFALAVLRHCYPAKYSDFHKAEAPDIQRSDHKSGVEVTLATDETIASIEGTSVGRISAQCAC